MIRVLIADDHPAVRAAVLDLLRETEGIAAVGEAVDGHEAVEMAKRVRPDVVLMDVSMPNSSGLEAARLLADERPDVRVLMFSAESTPTLVRAAREAGATGFLVKGCRGTDVVRAIRAASIGRGRWPSRP
ncbi:Response regulator receiver domain-containing protein [Blastococcus aurantiacus]|uniref:Response regulator receiver domain-containing protein n=1 Tax=Blastococcus aurantiacus TaxID=1550231 RepID=A0A1G7R8M4_9ACTN|nr:response regulator transcription factor [Blastococcus aurantiacus]SDG07151.1 Response regulator receiver domain-containing protein [Blastococcus aurantiacus]